jgi:hypothetical protein
MIIMNNNDHKMKLNTKNYALIIAVILFAGAMAGCQKGDNATPFGYNYIYMPQATFSGGTSLNYPVPSGLDSATRNYTIDKTNNKVNVLLGVLCSGKSASAGYNVNVAARKDTTSALIASSVITNGVLLPDGIYTLPATVTVPAGQNGATFTLSIDAAALKTYAGKKVAMTVQLSSPSMYTLNQAINKTVVIIDVTALKL